MAYSLLMVVATGCGIGRGYAPEQLTVYTANHGRPGFAEYDSLRLVSWNIQYGESVPQALRELAADSDLSRADIILLQEMTPTGVDTMARALGMYSVYAPAAVHPHHAELFGNAVLSRWPIVRHRALILPHGTPVSGHRRMALAADIDIAGQPLRAVSIHTATVILDQDKRMEQAHAALDTLRDFAGPVIIGGDFNSVLEYEVTQFTRLFRKAGFRRLRLPPGGTVGNRYRKVPGQDLVMDHLFYRGLTAGRRGVVRSATASDHWPIWGVFEPLGRGIEEPHPGGENRE